MLKLPAGVKICSLSEEQPLLTAGEERKWYTDVERYRLLLSSYHPHSSFQARSTTYYPTLLLNHCRCY